MIKALLPVIAALSLVVLVTNASATERRFAFTYETTTAPKGTFEVEQSTFWERGSGFDTFLFRQEIEFGITWVARICGAMTLELWSYAASPFIRRGSFPTSPPAWRMKKRRAGPMESTIPRPRSRR